MSGALMLWCMANVTLAAALAVSAPGIVQNAWPYAPRILERLIVLAALEIVAIGGMAANVGVLVIGASWAMGIGG